MPISESVAIIVPRALPVKYQKIAILGCFLNIATKGTIAVFETMAAQYDINLLHGSSFQTGLVVSISGFIGVFILILFHQLTKRFSDFRLIVGGIFLMIISCGVLGFSNMFFVSVILMYSVAYPIGHTAVLGMFSKIIEDGPQGKMMGWFASSGSLARVIFPILAGVVSNSFEDSIIFIVMFIMLIFAMIVTAWFEHDIAEITFCLDSC